MLYRLEHVSVAFGAREVLKDVSLQQSPGEKLILLGRNGCGKTTLLRLLAGQVTPDSGTVERARDLAICTLEQVLGGGEGTPVLEFCLSAFPQLLAAEREMARLQADRSTGAVEAGRRLQELHDLIDRIDGFRARPRAQATLQGLGIPAPMHQRPLATLSGGERTRVGLARVLLSDASLLLLDEPTNHLDLLGVSFLAEALAERGSALLLVTHDRDLVDRVGGEIVELHGGRVERYRAGYQRYRRERAQRRSQARREWELQQAEIARQEEFIRRNIAGQNTRQAQARIKLLEKVERLEPPDPDLAPFRLRWPETMRSGTNVLETRALAAGHGEPLVSELTLSLRRGERLVVLGRNGVGKTTLLQTLAGRILPLAGVIRLGTGVMLGWYDQEHTDLPPAESVLEVLLAARPDWTPAEARGWAARFGFSGDAVESAPDELSGGERSRLGLARLLALGPNVMLLDEPTNHLDLPSCEVLEDALEKFGGAVLLVTHDRKLAEKIATGVLLLDGGRAVQVNRVDEAFARLGLSRREEPPRSDKGTGLRRSAIEEERRKLRRDAARARVRADGLAVELNGAEARLREVEEALCDRTVFGDADRVRSLTGEASELRGVIDELIGGWSEAEEEAVALADRLAALETTG